LVNMKSKKYFLITIQWLMKEMRASSKTREQLYDIKIAFQKNNNR